MRARSATTGDRPDGKGRPAHGEVCLAVEELGEQPWTWLATGRNWPDSLAAGSLLLGLRRFGAVPCWGGSDEQLAELGVGLGLGQDAGQLVEDLVCGAAGAAGEIPGGDGGGAAAPGAVSIPADELEARLDELPDDVEVVAYCRGPYCVMSPQAVTVLRRHGRAARQLEDGFPEWRIADLPVEAAAAR